MQASGVQRIGGVKLVTLSPPYTGWVSLEKSHVIILAEAIWESGGLLRPRETSGQWDFGYKLHSQPFAYTKEWAGTGIGLGSGVSWGARGGWLASGPKGREGTPLGPLRDPHCLLRRIGICLWISSVTLVSHALGMPLTLRGHLAGSAIHLDMATS